MKPAPLVERYLRQVVDERVDARGRRSSGRMDQARDAERADRCAARREGRGDRGLPAQFLHQSRATS